MLEHHCRKIFDRIFVKPIVHVMPQIMRPWHVTLLAVFFGFLSCVFIAASVPVMAIIFLLLSGYCDTLDGVLARERDLSSELGAVFDIVADRLVEFLVILGLLLVNPAVRAMPSFFMLGAVLLCVTAFLVVSMFLEDDSAKSFAYSAGLMERGEAFIFFVLMILFPSAFVFLAWLFVILVTLTAIIHVVRFSPLSS